MPINISKPFLPPLVEFMDAIAPIWNSHQLTNNGALVQELEATLCKYLGVEHLVLCANGTIAMQLALEVYPAKQEVITTPFTYVATLDSILWQKCTPVFVDILQDDFCINPAYLKNKITANTRAILATHIFGQPCAIEEIEAIASLHDIPVIYDGAHAFACTYKGKSLLSYGDISTCSFNATKIFHTVEGGCIITKDAHIAKQLKQMRYFGMADHEIQSVGLNAKQSELHAAMGLVNLHYVDKIKHRFQEISERYSNGLKDCKVKIIVSKENTTINHAYFPLVFDSEEQLLKVVQILNEHDIFPRRYFFPSLNTLPFVACQPCPVAEAMSKRILCLPVYYDLSNEQVDIICKLIEEVCIG